MFQKQHITKKKKKNPVSLKPEWKMFYTLTNIVMNLHNTNRLYTQHNEMVSILSKKKLRMLPRSFRKALFLKKKKKTCIFAATM